MTDPDVWPSLVPPLQTYWDFLSMADMDTFCGSYYFCPLPLPYQHRKRRRLHQPSRSLWEDIRYGTVGCSNHLPTVALGSGGMRSTDCVAPLCIIIFPLGGDARFTPGQPLIHLERWGDLHFHRLSRWMMASLHQISAAVWVSTTKAVGLVLSGDPSVELILPFFADNIGIDGICIRKTI